MVGTILVKGGNDTMSRFRAQCFFGVQTMRYEVEKSKVIKWTDQLQMEKITWHVGD
jgi:hypothetical protein